MEITPDSIKFLFNRFQTDYQRGWDRWRPRWQMVADRIPSSTKLNTYAWMSDLPAWREWIGPRVFHNISARAYFLANKDWENSFALSRNDIEDDQFGIFSRRTELLGQTAAKLWDDLVFDTLKAGVSNPGWDGQNFFDTDHPVNPDNDAAGVYSNLKTGRSLTGPNVSATVAEMMAYKGDSGRPMEIEPTLLIVPPQLADAAFQAVKAPVYGVAVGSGAVALPNPLTNNALLSAGLEVAVIPRLSDEPDIWYLASTTGLKPIILQVRKEPEFQQRMDPSYDNVFYRKEFEFGGDARGAAGYGMPFTIIRVSQT